jgi:membrane-bound ClpP family serine protease
VIIVLIVVICLLLAGAYLTSCWGNTTHSVNDNFSHSTLIGMQGVAQNTFVEDGMILVNGELWKAESRQGIIEKGFSVEVVQMLPGLRLEVKPLVVKRVEE